MQNGDVGTVKSLYTYPIKGLSAVPHIRMNLCAGEGCPGDRLYGFAKGNSGFDPADPRPLPKDRFLVLMQHARIAGLATAFDPKTNMFIVKQGDQICLNADLGTEEGRAAASAFFVGYLDLDEAETPFFANAEPHRFTDVSVVSKTMMNAVSILNLASVKDFEARIGTPVDPLRFRANIVIDGLPPFAEFEWVDRIVKIGAVSFRVLLRTKRCAATEVNPATAERDIRLPALLRKTYGHFDMGIYAEVISDGTVSAGDSVTLRDA